MTGTLYGIGVGPGDPELITLKAHRILTSCPVVAWPAPDHGAAGVGESFARSIVAHHIHADQLEIPIIVPMKTERFPAKEVYDHAAVEIGNHLKAGSDVCVLCEGDPFFYGSFMYLFERLADDHRVEIVPGVSSLMASAAALQQPLAARNDVLTIIPAPLPDAVIMAALKGADAVAILKLGRHLPRLRALIGEAGLLGSAFYLERIGLPNQRVLPLAELEDDTAPYFSMIQIYKGAEEWIASRAPLGGDAS